MFFLPATPTPVTWLVHTLVEPQNAVHPTAGLAMALIVPQTSAYRAMVVRSAQAMRSARLAPSLVHVKPRPAPRWPASRSNASSGHFRGSTSAASAAERDAASQADLEDALENAAAEAQAAEAAAAAAAEAAAAARARAEGGHSL